MSESYTNLQKILRVLESNLSAQSIINTKTIVSVEESFKSLLTTLKIAEKDEDILNSLSNSVLIQKYLSVFSHHISSSNNLQQQQSASSKQQQQQNQQLLSFIDKFAIYSLRSLGYFIFLQPIVQNLQESTIKEISSILENTILVTKNKNICNYALWCFSSQNLPNGPISNKLPSTYTQLLATTPFESKTVEAEILTSFYSLLIQNPSPHLLLSTSWLPSIFIKMIDKTNAPEISEKLTLTVDYLKKLYNESPEMFPDDFSNGLVDKLEMFLEGLMNLFESNLEERAITYWGYFICFIKKHIFPKNLMNKLLKLPEKCFLLEKKEARLLAFKSWRSFIDALDTHTHTTPKRLKLIVSPLAIGFESAEVEIKKESFKTWLYLLNALNAYTKSVVDFNVYFSPLFETCMSCPELSTYALHLLAAYVSPSKDVRKESKLVLKDEFDCIVGTLPLQNIPITSKWVLDNFNTFTMAIQSLGQELQKQKLEIWTGFLKRVFNIDQIKESPQFIQISQNIFLFIQMLLATLDINGKSEANLNYYKEIFSSTLKSFPVSNLISSTCKVELNTKSFIYIDFLILNILEFGFKLNSEQYKELVLPLFEEMLVQIAFSNAHDFSQKISFVLDIINDNIPSPTSSHPDIVDRNELEKIFVYLLDIWLSLLNNVKTNIEKSHQLLSLPTSSINHLIDAFEHLLIWPMKMISSHSKDCKRMTIIIENSKLWRNTFGSIVKIFSTKTNLTPFIIRMIGQVGNFRYTNKEYLDFILLVLSIFINELLNGMSSSSSSSTATTTSKKRSSGEMSGYYSTILESFISIDKVLIDCHFSKTIVEKDSTFLLLSNQLSVFNGLSAIVKKANSFEFTLGALKNLKNSLHLYINSPKPDNQLLEKIQDHQDKYQTTLVKRSIQQFWETCLETIQNTKSKEKGSSSSPFGNNDLLVEMEETLIDGFKCKTAEIKECTLQFWNSTFGQSTSLVYPFKLGTLLVKLKEKGSQVFMDTHAISNSNSNHRMSTYGESQATLGFDNDYQSIDIPVSQFQKLNNQNGKLRNQVIKEPTIATNTAPTKRDSINNHNNHNTLKPAIKKVKMDEYVNVLPDTNPDASTQSLTEHQMEVLGREIRTQSFGLSEVEDIEGQITTIYNKLLENQSTRSLLSIQQISLKISERVNRILKERLFK
ncbi:hypothetical protein CYY_001624 [Polysphondylium violaceum]|uniref:Telomere-associated protein Rif1 N-terminal domain-containing protein n=1 Tax=Polysphondylium violaceum TaxID=133409 RepID=A0A8J4V7Q9_9MYCE|nr:hypothetical protein CYY_001624 [Polysphondylium violaceum]